jgi:hypothetical protein
MPIHFIDNYGTNLDSIITKEDGSPLHGELWFYQELRKFNEHNFLKDETWYVKHSYNLSEHPSGDRKVEGEIDFLILSKYGILLVEIKGGGVEVDANDTYYSREGAQRFETQNPFVQVKDYAHSLKRLIRAQPFIYRAVIFPHEPGFELKGPQLSGYRYLFFSKKELLNKETHYARNKALFEFLTSLARDARRKIIVELNPLFDSSKIDRRVWTNFPELNKTEINRLRAELFPTQTTYGFNPDRIKNEILLAENYEILNGLKRNRKVLVQGAPGTGKTVLATKYLAESLMRQQKGVFICANKLLRSRMEHLAHVEYGLDQNSITFKIFFTGMAKADVGDDIDFVIIDEAQEFFDKGLAEFVEAMDKVFEAPRWLILYDPDQAIMQDFKDIDWYASFFISTAWVHYHFDTVWRCCQNKEIIEIIAKLKNSRYKTILSDHNDHVVMAVIPIERLKVVKGILDTVNFEFSKYVFLVHSDLLEDFHEFARTYFSRELEELTDGNINVVSQKVRYTTPLKYKGLECDNVLLVTPGLNDKTRIQNYVGITRAINDVKILIWT